MKNVEKYAAICDRIESLGYEDINRGVLLMDLECADIEFGLKLDELLAASDFDFAHDVIGIYNNINRKSYPVADFGFFVPRFASR